MVRALGLLALVALGCSPRPVDPRTLDEATFERELARRFQYPPPEPIPAEVEDPGAGQAADAAYFLAFPDLDRSYSREARAEARRLAERLRDDAAGLSHEAFVLRVAEITALADNAHTAIDALAFLKNTPRLPIRTHLFPDGLFVLRAKSPHDALVGARIDSIDGRSIDEIFRALARYQGGLDARRRLLLTPVLESPALLEAAGLARERGALTLAGLSLDGVPFEVRVDAEERDRSAPISNTSRLLYPPVPGTTPEGMTAWLEIPEPLPPSLRDGSRLFTTAPLERGGLYIGITHNHDGDEEPIRPFLERVLEEVARDRPSYLVVDLRLDRGGDYTKTYAFAHELPRRLGPTGRIYVLTSSWTFSAAITTTAALVQAGGDRVWIVGEPVGDRLEFWAEGGAMQLPNAFLRVYYAAGKHDYRKPCLDVDDCFWLNDVYPVRVDDLEPRIRAPFPFADYRAGRDPALEAVQRAEAGH